MHDLQRLREPDVVFVLGDKSSYGTAIEMFVAKNSCKKIKFIGKGSGADSIARRIIDGDS